MEVDEESKTVPQFSLPFVHGTSAWWLGKKSDSSHSHRWTVYVRGDGNRDISYCVEKVVFTLHQSFGDPVRVLTQPPYEVTETGWGEFEIQVRMYFRDPAVAPVEFGQLLKLYPPGSQAQSTKKPVIAEQYDEVLFTGPSPEFTKILTERVPVHVPKRPHPEAKWWSTFDDREDLEKITKAHAFVKQEIEVLKAKLLDTEGHIHSYKEDIVRLGGTAV